MNVFLTTCRKNHKPKNPSAAQIPTPYVVPSAGAGTSDGLPFGQLFVIQETAELWYGIMYCAQ